MREIGEQRASHSAHILREAGVSAVINGAIGALFFFALFGGVDVVPVAGPGGYALDFLPQSAAVAFMAGLVPALLARRAILHGRLTGRRSPVPAVGRLVMHALLCAALAALPGGVIALLLLKSGVASVDHAPALIFKIAYGALLGTFVTWQVLRRLLAQPVSAKD